MERLISFIGLLTIVGVVFLFSKNRKAVRWKTVAWGFGLQAIFALLIFKVPGVESVFALVNDVVISLLDSTKAGAGFVFGNLVEHAVPVEGVAEGAVAKTGAFFAFAVLPTIIFFSALMAVLYHLGVIQKVVLGLAWVMAKTMKTSGAESLSASANIFVGQTEAPLVVRPYVKNMTESELMAVMSGGFATVAGGVMAAYVFMLRDVIPDIAGHLLAASIMAAPASLALSKIFVPETGEPETAGMLKSSYKQDTKNVVDAAASGAGQGLTLALNVGAMLIAFLALVALVNGLLGWAGSWVGLVGENQLSLDLIFGKVLSVPAFLIGIPWADCTKMGDLLGTKLMINEFIAYAKLQTMIADGSISERTAILASYALCGFANLGSVGIQLGGIGGIAPERKGDLASLGLRAMFSGALSTCSAACMAGIFL